MPLSEENLRDLCEECSEILLKLDTSEEGKGKEACVRWLKQKLEDTHFDVSVKQLSDEAPLVVARRLSKEKAPLRILIYNHYDVDLPEENWTFPPYSKTEWQDPKKMSVWFETGRKNDSFGDAFFHEPSCEVLSRLA